MLLVPVRASAQVVSAAASGGASAVSAAAGAARAPMAIGAMPLQSPALSIQSFSAAPTVAPALAPSAMTALPAASRAAAAVEAAPAASAAVPAAVQAAVPAAAAPSAAPALPGRSAAALTGVFRADAKTAAAPSAAAAEARMSVLFDGAETRRAADDSAPVAGILSSLSAASVLDKSAPAAPIERAAVPSVASRVPRPAVSFAKKALLAVALILALPGIALAAPVGGPVITSVTALSYLAGIQPLAAAAGAVLGAVFGMFASRSKDGSPVSAGEVFSSILSYGVLGGAGVYVLLDVTHMAFAGVAASPLQPITTAIATAALGRTAFQDKFTDPATSSADRITGAFPAVAASVGISVATVMGLLAIPAAAVLATHAMAVTGVATALFAALYKPGQSPVDGPARMAKGFVLQALMMGLALAMTNQILFAIFAAMGVAGFGLVLWAAALELWAHRPGAPSQPLPPAPPVKKDPPASPPAGAGSAKNLIEQ